MLTNEAASRLVSEQLRRMKEELKETAEVVLLPPSVLQLDEGLVDMLLFNVVLGKVAFIARLN